MKIKKHIPWILPSLAGLYFLSSLKLPRISQGPDWVGFGNLPALHNGRIKPLDTIARTTLLMLRGKQVLPVAGRPMNAMQWMLDVMARPEEADTYNVFVIQDPDILGLLGREQKQEKYFSFSDLQPFLKEIENQASLAEKEEAQSRSRYQTAVVNLQDRLMVYQSLKNSLRVEGTGDFPEEIILYEKSLGPGLKALEAHQKKGFRFNEKDLRILNSFFEKYHFLSQVAYFRPLIPSDSETPENWKNLGEGLLEMLMPGTQYPGLMAYAQMVQAYRVGRAAQFNEVLAKFRDGMKTRSPHVWSLAKSELLFNFAEPFYQGMILYLVVFLLIFVSWLVWPDVLQKSAFYLLGVAFFVHTLGLLARIILQGRPPVTNLYSSAVFVGWVAVLLGIVLEKMYRKSFGSLVASVIGFSTLIIAHHLMGQGDTMEMMRAVLDSNFWLATHVVTITIGYGGTFLAGTLAHVYIFRKIFAPGSSRASTHALVQMTYGIVCFSLFFSFVGTILGGIWADQSWGRFWGWDPKENGALLIVLWNAIILHALWGKYVQDRGFMVMAVFGNIVTSLSWFGVNMLGIGLHSYGFMDKAFYWLLTFVLTQFAVMSLGLLSPEFFRKQA
ncbi:MAG: cytochrome c biogenesis protein CcsA [Elusimicrobia bacterium]|nr:cytochrome c biogenesis protein CcsA [Elusimicrobiota bacterium]